MFTRFLIPALLVLAAAPLHANEASAWAAVEALDSAKPSRTPSSPEEARTLALEIIQKKEMALRQFIARYPQSRKAVEAKIRLAHLLLTKSDFTNQPHLAESATGIINAALSTANPSERPDYLYAKITLAMRRMKLPSESDRERLSAEVNAFKREYPNDRRIPALLAELATLYDHQPKQKEKLLKEALERSPSPELAERIRDDLKRIALLGQPVSLEGPGLKGETVSLTALRGKVVVVYFFASFSGPSLSGLKTLQELRQNVPGGELEIVGICLDPSVETARSVVSRFNVSWPVVCDGEGWHSQMVRQLGINSLPTCWVLDRKGILRTLNVRDNLGATVEALLSK